MNAYFYAASPNLVGRCGWRDKQVTWRNFRYDS
jgi:hypothetical protein